MSTEGFLMNKGDYRNLVVYQIAEVIFYFSNNFTEKFLNPRDRTVDQMVQPTRSGKQNIAEESVASTISAENKADKCRESKS